MEHLSAIWFRIQHDLFPYVAEVVGKLSLKQKQLVAILELLRIEDHIPPPPFRAPGRPLKDRAAIARAFVLKAVYNLPTTRAMIELLEASPKLRRICGWEFSSQLPSEAVFSRVFKEFTDAHLPEMVHASIIEHYERTRVVGHISRDSMAVKAREKPVRKSRAPAPETPTKTRTRAKKGAAAPHEPTRLHRQAAGMTLTEMLADLPTACDRGCKRNSKGYIEAWTGRKFHVDWGDGGIPLSFILTSASLHDSQVAIPLATMTHQRLDTVFYELMDSAYDAAEIRSFITTLGHVPIIEWNSRGGAMQEFDPATKVRYNERTTAERGFGRLEDEFGARMIRVRGHAKMLTHLAFCIIALFADQLLKLVC